MRFFPSFLCLLWASLASAQGTLPIALQQQFSFVGCSTTGQACGTPLTGGLLYFYQVGTVATPQNSYQDTALTILNPWPLILDANGRVPPFYLANGSIHPRLTDAAGVVQFDYPSMLVIGPSGGGGGGSGIDPTTIASTGDIKFRATSETLTGWVKLNGLTIGSAVSGATGRANADTQSLFTYLWTNCPNTHCAVTGGRGATAAADFAANKQITLLDLRGRSPWGLDDMGNVAAGRLQPSNVTSGGGDTTTTPNATGGEGTHTLTLGELPASPPSGAISGSVTFTGLDTGQTLQANVGGGIIGINGPLNYNDSRTVNGSSFTLPNLGSGQAGGRMGPFMLGSWFAKL